MHRFHGDQHGDRKLVDISNWENDWGQSNSERNHGKHRRAGQRPHRKFSKTNRLDWLRDLDYEEI